MEPLKALVLAAYVLASALLVGYALLGPVRSALSESEHVTLGWAVGMGGLAIALTLVGLAGSFRPLVVLLLPGALAAAALAAGRAPGVGRLRHGVAALSRAPAVWPLSLLAGFVALSGLAPPSDYDGLLYHLVAPRAYLEAGAFVYLPHNFSANLPMFGETLFAVGLAGGSDRAPQLVHAGAGALTVALTWVLAHRLLAGRLALWAAAGVAGTPLVPFLATRAYIDLFTVVFVTAALVLLVVWWDTRRLSLLAFTGALLGFAVSSKYSALTAALPLGALAALAALARDRRSAVRAAIALGGAGCLAALPWTVRQHLLLGNPVWPMYTGGRDWDAARVEQLAYFVGQYGSGHTVRDWLLLPLNVFRESWRFGHVPW
ncbi:MAG TPA: glycosyltransferase family 39 protein, partial [Chloroflexota bacterium]|nr:glycosyltransferase family 39 protein [Chloroflexota bacterium]